MTHRFLLLFLLAIALFNSCSEKVIELTELNGQEDSSFIVPSKAEQGHFRLKFQAHLSDEQINSIILSSTNYKFVRSIPSAGNFEPRHRDFGLHLWYEVYFDETIPLTKAASGIKDDIDGISIIEFVTPIVLNSTPFNDPYFPNHWHYFNNGDAEGKIAGSDINLIDAWKINTGSRDVIVAVNDGGIDYRHEDLAANMWINEAELNGIPYFDDDGNGYEDDIYGYNFCVNGSNLIETLSSNNHGTHIAGTIAAVNNNGVGVNGIAGGNSPSGNGIRLMSTQTNDNDNHPAQIGNAIVYAADMGAVIMNCSWSVGEDGTPEYISEAINYFNECAGFDINGNQVGPMAGGVCFFAAGNENRQDKSYPAMDDNVVAVASIGADMEKAYYSNYGDWVDITAPGGDVQKGFQIYSTLPDNRYGKMQGTSMAAPHLTGVAALVVSKYGGQGFTRDKLIHILQSSANKVIYDYNPGYNGKLGAGLVDATAALKYTEDTSGPVTIINTNVVSNKISLSWDSPSTGAENIYTYTIYLSDKDLSALDTNNVPKEVISTVVPYSSNAYEFTDLKFSTKYYIRINTQSVLGTESELSEQIIVQTLENHAPVIEALSSVDLKLKAHEKGVLKFRITDEDNHDILFSKKSDTNLDGLSYVIDGDILIFNINALNAKENTIYKGVLEATDGYTTSSLDFSYTIDANHAPEQAKEFENIVFNGNRKTLEFKLSDYFADPDGEILSYEAGINTTAIIAKCEVVDGVLKLTSNSFGYTEVELKAFDARGAAALASFKLLVRDGSRPVDLYPNPVEKFLNIRSESDSKLSYKILNKAGTVLLEESELSAGPFNPKAVDLSNLPTGKYYVSVSVNGEAKSYPIVKK